MGGRPKIVYPNSVRENLGRRRCLALRCTAAPKLEWSEMPSESGSRRRCSRSLEDEEGSAVLEVERGSAFAGGFEADSERDVVKHGRHEANAARTLSV